MKVVSAELVTKIWWFSVGNGSSYISQNFRMISFIKMEQLGQEVIIVLISDSTFELNFLSY